VSLDQALLTQLTTNYSAFQAQQAQINDSVRIASEAQIPTSAASPNTSLDMLLGAAAGLVIGMALAALLQLFDQRIRTEEDVEERVGVDLLGRIPAYSPTGGRGHGSDVRVAGEAYRRLRTNLQFASLDAPLGVVVVTSASAREGKTLTSSNLASVLAASGRRTLLLDADLRRPRLHKVFGKSLHNGLSEMLLRARETQRIDPEQFVERTSQPNLWILTAGVIPPNPAEMLASSHMEKALETMIAVYDVVIIDTPPLGVVADAAIVAARASGAILVLEASRTGVRPARAAAVALARSGVRIYGAVLNKATGAGEGYGSYEKYYYSSDADDDDVDTDTAANGDASAGVQGMRRERSWTPIVEPVCV
jgi:capsular exopolysaccharide synthesis family protein